MDTKTMTITIGTTIRIGARDVTLRAPTSPSLLADIYEVSLTSAHRGLSAALGMCWTGAGRPKAHLIYGRTAEYGGRVYDELIARGEDPSQLVEAAGEAFRLVMAAQLGITREEVDAAAVFSEAPDGSTS